jgi:hypothetical protein
MKTIRNLLVLTALCVAASAQSNSNSAAEQRYFNLEDSVQNRVDLADAELASLANDDLIRKELNQDPPIPKLTQDGLEATVVHLCGSGERDLVVIGDGEAYAGANVGPFWIIRDLPAGPIVVLSEISLGLTIETKRSNKCLNVQAIAATAVESTTTDFSFNGEKYVVTRQKSQKLGR